MEMTVTAVIAVTAVIEAIAVMVVGLRYEVWDNIYHRELSGNVPLVCH
ncbi:MAG: hypothetical protein LBJ00_00890 [Planctomycetaceae bacterium]|nr:hypothetical protein [Planctomycetaceae bacterium]